VRDDPIAIQPIGPFQAALRPPGSKSLTNRALLLAALAEGRSIVRRALLADDTLRMIEALETLGLAPRVEDGGAAIHLDGRGGQIPETHAQLYLGNAGTAYRFLTAACCLGHGEYSLDGIERMRQRPIAQLVEALTRIGASISYLRAPGFPPLSVRGSGLRGGELTLPPTLSSQYISALLLVAPYCKQGLTMAFDGPVTSRPYVEMTLALMAQFGIEAAVPPDFSRVRIEPGCYRGLDLTIEPDASNASYFLAAAAIIPGSKCTIEGLGRGSLQGDVGFADLLHQMGAGLTFGPDFITVLAPPQGQPLRAIDVDLNAMPDMAQTLAAVALFAEGTTVMRNIGNLRVKETDRIAAMQKELTKLGATVEIDGDDLSITSPPSGGGGGIRPAVIDTYDDHRMAMSFAIVGLRAPGVVINNPRCVDKTFPEFFEYLGRLRRI
jgi:3-phosphoshikimate 1-carboxyvinyltransferase